MSTDAPSKRWTLRLKRGTRTTVLFADPAQSLTQLKRQLLDALQNQPSRGTDEHVPSSAADVELGAAVDVNDLAAGWALLEHKAGEDGEEEAEQTGKKGKGRAKAKSATAEKNLTEWGVADNAVLVYRFRGEAEADGGDETLGEEGGWDVSIPVFEDLYGVDNEGDLGALPEYRG